MPGAAQASAHPSILARPFDAGEISLKIVMGLKLTLVSIDNGVSDPPGQVNVGRRYHKLVSRLIDPDDPLERMLRLLCLLGIPHKLDDLSLMLRQKAAA
jgi:hypothetical protein